MTDRLPQSVYDAIQSAYDEAAATQPARSSSSHTSHSGPAPRSKLCDVPLPKRSMRPSMADLELRDLHYLESDSHLSCPICHVTFIDPVYVECGHHFCAECLATYWRTARRTGNRKPCPACRTLVTSSKCASRLIVNMCNDVMVHCPLEACGQTMPRSALESHLTSYCPERNMECGGRDCDGNTKRKYFLPDQCRHDTHVECECGGLIPNGMLELHREKQCPSRQTDCLHCSRPVSSPDHHPESCQRQERCPGKDVGCDAILDRLDVEEHVKHCFMAKMVPYLESLVANSVAPLQTELLRSQQRVTYLEEGIDKLYDSIESSTNHVKESRPDEPADLLSSIATGSSSSSSASSSSSSSPPTPSPLPAATPSASSPPPPPPLAAVESAAHLHLLALHEDLRHLVADLSHSVIQLGRTVEEVDARNSMLMVNETLRLKEELALTNNGLYSTRAQVQWLLNRERAGQQPQPQLQSQLLPGVRGRIGQGQISPGGDLAAVSKGAAGAAAVAAAAGPLFGSSGQQALRPARRTSAGSQERVKL